ncbi:uncharacterized protein LOC101157968 isoform X2 [Oryzias latipes]
MTDFMWLAGNILDTLITSSVINSPIKNRDATLSRQRTSKCRSLPDKVNGNGEFINIFFIFTKQAFSDKLGPAQTPGVKTHQAFAATGHLQRIESDQPADQQSEDLLEKPPSLRSMSHGDHLTGIFLFTRGNLIHTLPDNTFNRLKIPHDPEQKEADMKNS